MSTDQNHFTSQCAVLTELTDDLHTSEGWDGGWRTVNGHPRSSNGGEDAHEAVVLEVVSRSLTRYDTIR